jgi:hypothetical protein
MPGLNHLIVALITSATKAIITVCDASELFSARFYSIIMTVMWLNKYLNP